MSVSKSEAGVSRRMRLGLLGTTALFGLALASAASAQNVLVYVDANAGTSAVNGAIGRAGLTGTTTYTSNFVTGLSSGSYDLVIYARQSNSPSGSETTALQNYLAGGGRVIASTWTSSALDGIMGAVSVGINASVITADSSGFFTGLGSTITLSNPGWGTYSRSYQATGGAVAYGALGGGYAVIVGNGGRSAYLGPLTDSYGALSEGERFIANAITSLLSGYTPPLPDINGGQTYTTNQLASSQVNAVFNGGTLTVSASGEVTNAFTVNGAGGIMNGAGQSSTFSGVFADGSTPGGSLTINGGGSVGFSGANTFTGGIIVDGATLVLNNTQGAGAGTIHMVDPQIDFAVTGTYANDISLEVADGQQATDPTILNNTTGDHVNLTGRIYETAGVGGANQYVTFAGSGVFNVSNGANSWGGVTTINNGVVVTGTTSSISGASIVNNGALIYTNTTAGTASQNISGSGSISITGTGPVTLNGNISTSGQMLVDAAGATLTLGGARTGSNNTGVVLTSTNGVLTVANTGSIQSGQFNGVRVSGRDATVNNLGTIRNTGTGGDGGVGAGVYVANGGAGGVTTVTNGSVSDTGAGSVIQGRNAGVRHEAGSTDTLVVNNHGHIIGDIYNGIENTAGALTVNNYSGGYIWTLLGNGISSNSAGAVNVTNAGVIGQNAAGTQTVGGYGVTANGVLTVNNQGGGLIIGNLAGVIGQTTAGVTNAGTINGGVGYGVISNGALTVTNQTGGIITSQLAGAQANNTLTLTNAGTINVTAGNAVNMNLGGSVTNNAGGSISGNYGVYNQGGDLTLNTSAGSTISGVTAHGVITFSNATVTNGGSISGFYDGIHVAAGSTVGLTNTGTISANTYAGLYATGATTITNSGTLAGGSDTNGSGVGINIAGGLLDLTNQAGGQITGASGGVRHNTANAGTISNAGLIGGIATFNTGALTINNLAGGVISNANSAIDSQQGGRLAITNAGAVTGGQWGIVGRNAADSITNSGTITGTNQQGVIMNGGTLNNQATGVIRGGTNGVQLDNNTALTNAGQIHGGLGNFQQGVFAQTAGSTVTNQSGGVIDGWRGVTFGAAGTVSNAGTIQSFGNIAVGMFNGGTVNNLAGGVITSNNLGVYVAGSSALNLTNAGQIHGGLGSFQYGVRVFNGNGVVNNQAGGVIDGWRGVEFNGAGSTLNNAGRVQSFDNYAVILFGAGTVNNLTGGLITSNIGGVYANGVTLTLTNAGTITGGQYNAVSATAGGTIDNQLGGVINATPAGGWGIWAGANTTVTNAGVINADSGIASSAGVLTLTNTGTVNGTVDGLLGAGGVFNVTNSGTISASDATSGRGMNLASGANTVTNQAGGDISGWRGIELAANAGGSTITNAGSIIGTSYGVVSGAGLTVTNQSGGVIDGTTGAMLLAGSGNTLNLNAGSTVNGVIDASLSTGHNVVNLAGAANGGYIGGSGADDVTLSGGMTITDVLNGMDGVDSLTLSGAANGALNTSVLGGFESRAMNGTGTWTLSGVDGDASTWTLNSGVLRTTGNQSINNAAGVVINAGGTLAVIDSEAIGALSGTGSVVISDLQALLVGADDSSSTFDGVISGLGGLQHLGTGVLTLTGANTYTGATVVSAGTLQLGASGVIADGSDLSIASGATLDMQGFNETVDLAIIGGTLNGTGTLTGSEYQLNGATVNANLGAGNLFNVSGSSTLNGTAASANVTVSAGTLTLGAANRLNDAAVLTIASGATFDLDGHNETVGSAYINGTLEGFGVVPPPAPIVARTLKADDGPQVLPGVGTGTLTASQYVLDGAAINGNLGAGNLFNIGGVSTLTGLVGAASVTVQAGTLRLEAAERLSNAATLTVSTGATFDLHGHNETVNLAVINGTLDGFGTVALPIGWSYDKAIDVLVESLPGIGTGTLTASQYQLNAATINGNLGAGTLFNVSGVSTLNGTVGANAVSVLTGTLRLGAANRLADAATLSVSSGATLDLQSFNDTINLALLNGTLAGTGTLTAGEYQLNGASVNANLGVGNLFNTGDVSVLNGTSNAANVSVQAGTLRLGASDRISNAADLSVSAGATFDLNGNMETVRGLFGSGNVTAGAGRLTFGGVDSGFNGVLSGTGSVVHTGGLFALMNSHTINMLSNTGGELRFLGSTTGNVSVSGGSMTGAGTIGGALTVSGGATLSPGLAGVNNDIGSFQTGSLVMNGGRLALNVLGVSGGSLSDVIQVTGNANLTGGILAPNFRGPVTDFDFSTRYLFLTAGSRTGTFANGSSFTADPGGLAGLYWRVRYDLVANGAVIELRQLTDFTGSDGTTNQNQVAGGLSEGQLEASDDWANVLSAFAGLDRDEQLEAFDSAGGEAIADISTSLFSAIDSFLNAVRGAGGSQPNGGTSMAFASTLGFIGGREGESAMVANVLGAFDPGAEAAAGNGGWLSAYAGDAKLEGKPGQADVQTQLNGFAGGWATTQGDVTVGVAGGVTRVEGDVNQRASTYESDLTHGAAFMRFDNGTWSAGVTGSLYGGQIDSRRTIAVGALTGVANGSTDGEGSSISASVSRRFHLDGDTMAAFGVETTASRINLDGFTETGAGGLSLDVTAQSRAWLTTVVSGRINRTWRVNGRDFGLYGGLGAMVTSGDRQALADMRFSGAATGFGDFTIEGAETAPVAGVADVGFETQVTDSAAVSVGYRGVFNERLDDHQVGVRIQIRW